MAGNRQYGMASNRSAGTVLSHTMAKRDVYRVGD